MTTPVKIPLHQISTPGLFQLLKDVTAILEARAAGTAEQRAPVPAPVAAAPSLPADKPAEADADFVLMIAARLRSGGYVKAEERRRVADVAQQFGPWVERQGLPTTHNAGDWDRARAGAVAPRARAR